VVLTAAPAQHFSGRTLWDRNRTLWASWAIRSGNERIFYSGDTGYGKLFQDIGARLGPFDMAFIKIGAYGPGQAWTDIHMTPEQAVQVHRDVRARRMFPVHWSTFNLAYHDWDEPIRRAAAEATRVGVELVTPRLGEVVDADRPFESTRWWEAVM
ncbi:MAG TPA: MBL fold metallo-hydrolase, partial [Steroidobacteraceae bacterium]|nr:MBL fold metallo-hydrolase [Steroidobacteraceae bacterium]